MLAALGGLVLFTLFRKPGEALGAPTNGGQIASLYGGGSLGDFAAAATIRADEASGVGKGFLLEPVPGLRSKAAGALGLGGLPPITAPVTILTTVPMLGVGPLGDYAEEPIVTPPAIVTGDEDIGVLPIMTDEQKIGMFPWTQAGLMFGGSKRGPDPKKFALAAVQSDAAPTSITLPSSSVPVMNQTIYQVDIASTGHPSETIKPTQEQPGMTANVRGPNIDLTSGSLGDFAPSVIPEIPRYRAAPKATPPPPPRSTARYMLF